MHARFMQSTFTAKRPKRGTGIWSVTCALRDTTTEHRTPELLKIRACVSDKMPGPSQVFNKHFLKTENVTFHHEGFFWRCWFNGAVEENDSNIWQFWYTNQPPSKNCTHAYLSPYPFMRGQHNSTSYDSAVIYRGFWAVLMLLGVVAVVTASFLIICAAPFASHFLYKAGGGSYIAAGILFSLVVMLYVIWVQAVADMESYKNMKMKDCSDFTPSVLYGWSFFLAPAGIFFSLLAGLLFLVVGRHIQIHH